MSDDEPVGIIGAGMAGIAAAYHLTKAGTPVHIFESREVIGGRARTLVEEGTPQPIELGAEFIHGAARPTLELMDHAGVHAESVPDRHVQYARGKFREIGETWSRFAGLFEGVSGDHDRSAEEYRAEQHFDRDDAELYRLMVEGFEAAPLADVSVQSLADEAREAAEDPAQFRPHGGYGALLRSMERSLDPEFTRFTLNAVVKEVHWQSDGRCALRVRQKDNVETVDDRRSSFYDIDFVDLVLPGNRNA
jgi:phytoene dehydrogenase-like protein